MQEKKRINHECECFNPEIRDSHKNGICSEKQIVECHGFDFLKSLKQNEIK